MSHRPRPPQALSRRRAAAGESLVEVLVSALLLAIGLLGLAALQVVALGSS